MLSTQSFQWTIWAGINSFPTWVHYFIQWSNIGLILYHFFNVLLSKLKDQYICNDSPVVYLLLTILLLLYKKNVRKKCEKMSFQRNLIKYMWICKWGCAHLHNIHNTFNWDNLEALQLMDYGLDFISSSYTISMISDNISSIVHEYANEVNETCI